MKWKEKFYQILVSRTPELKEAYQRRAGGRQWGGKLGTLCYLLWLNLTTFFPKRNPALPVSESNAAKREPPQVFAARLKDYDIISFDVFDTLIFRPFQKPADLFYLVGGRINYLNFCRLRIQVEQQARKRKIKEQGHAEVTISEIYDCFEQITGFSAAEAKKEELMAEQTLCFANEYLLEVVKILKRAGKRIIVVSDMYLPGIVIREILNHCGYTQIDEYYISCEYQASKADGRLYDFVKEKEHGRLVHIGDHFEADVRQAKRHGLDAFYYLNVNRAGNPYRAKGLSVLTGGIYSGLVNAKLYQGNKNYSPEYEYGFVYGGLLVLGYAQFIYNYVKSHNIEKVLFLARDGDILSQVYQKLYPEEAQRCAYVLWSRAAAAKLASGIYKQDYFRRFLFHKTDQGYTIKEIFHSMDLDKLTKRLEKETGISAEEFFTAKNIQKIKEWLEQNWDIVQEQYQTLQTAGKLYYESVLKGVQKACAVDVGWAGSGAVLLDTMVQKIWKLPCEITGLLAGTNSAHTEDSDMSEPQLKTGKLVSYLYSQEHNRELWNWHDPGKKHNLYFELLFSSPTPTFTGFLLQPDGSVTAKYGSEESNSKGILEIHKGILDFADQYSSCFRDYPETFQISGRDAYIPVQWAIQNRKYIQAIFQKFTIEKNVV